MSGANLLDRRSVVAALLAGRKQMIAVGGLGASTYDIAAAGDHDRNFYLWGAMGGAVMIGLGLALAQPELPVLVITGDGEMLMARPVGKRAIPLVPSISLALPAAAE
jgi:thiamine pyrophosphate-dependent acetolactate synthase large subunit-like protein